MFFFSSNPSFAKTPKVKVVSAGSSCVGVAAGEGAGESRTAARTLALTTLKNLWSRGESEAVSLEGFTDCFVPQCAIKGSLFLLFKHAGGFIPGFINVLSWDMGGQSLEGRALLSPAAEVSKLLLVPVPSGH